MNDLSPNETYNSQQDNFVLSLNKHNNLTESESLQRIRKEIEDLSETETVGVQQAIEQCDDYDSEDEEGDYGEDCDSQDLIRGSPFKESIGKLASGL